MLHDQIWRAIDEMAQRRGLTPSGLARAAGLDPTAFNKSKRVGPDGKPRWPSTESLSRIFAATGATLEDFASLMTGRDAVRGAAVPIVGMARAGADGFFDDQGFPIAAAETLRFPGLDDDHVYALEIAGESMEPLYRAGDIVIVQPSASVRRGDRVVVRARSGAVMAKTLARRTDQIIELTSVNPAYPPQLLRADDVEWIARIVWASQ
ncbi:MAG: helix-turn-helix transcriptional regulator [Alphaproteobacteria bacterium]|nr:helix-turn-helix transcriptional regulator [Alphaproteobacteria bacterium]